MEEDHPGVRLPPPLIYMAVLGVGLLLRRIAPLPLVPRAIGRPAAIGLALASIGLSVWGFASFRRSSTTVLPYRPATALITRGPFRLTRNPLYLSLLLLYLAVTFWIGALWPLLLTPTLVWLVQVMVIVKEERYLERKFGDSYRAYRTRVRRWL